jgi:hypothetical protein
MTRGGLVQAKYAIFQPLGCRVRGRYRDFTPGCPWPTRSGREINWIAVWSYSEIRIGRARDRAVLSGIVFMRVLGTDEFPLFVR